jgi:hypothetical protein
VHFTAKLKNTGTCSAVFSTCPTDSHSIMFTSGTGTGVGIGTGVGTGTGTGTGTGVSTGVGTGTGTGTRVGIEDLKLSITPQRVRFLSILLFALSLSL